MEATYSSEPLKIDAFVMYTTMYEVYATSGQGLEQFIMLPTLESTF